MSYKVLSNILMGGRDLENERDMLIGWLIDNVVESWPAVGWCADWYVIVWYVDMWVGKCWFVMLIGLLVDTVI